MNPYIQIIAAFFGSLGFAAFYLILLRTMAVLHSLRRRPLLVCISDQRILYISL